MSAKPNVFEDPRAVLRRYGLKPKRSWGQNFLISPSAVERIAEATIVSPGSSVIEIGAGLGTLTAVLLDKRARVTAIERDRDMCAVLRAEFGDEPLFELVEADAKSFDYRGHFAGIKGAVTGNLPYQLTGQILRRLMEMPSSLTRAVIMVQEEVAERLCAQAGTRERSALTVLMQARFHVQTLFKLSPGSFFPPPKIRSRVVVCEPKTDPIFDQTVGEREFDQVVRAAFSSRRKTLRNALKGAGFGSINQVEDLLQRANIDGGKRAEQLELEDFARMASVVTMNRYFLAATR